MAHYKRKKCRYHSTGTKHQGSETTFRVRLGLKPVPKDWRRSRIPIDVIWPRWLHNVYASSPAHWDRTYHTRPHRVRTKRMERQILMGLIDADDAAWPVPNRPQVYYW